MDFFSKKAIALAIFLSSSIAVSATAPLVASANEGINSPGMYDRLYIDGMIGWGSASWVNSLNYIFPLQTSTHISNQNGGFTLSR